MYKVVITNYDENAYLFEYYEDDKLIYHFISKDEYTLLGGFQMAIFHLMGETNTLEINMKQRRTQ